jgi:hypothetical protein
MCITFFPKVCRLSLHFVYHLPSFHTVSKNILETKVEAFNDNEICPFFTAYRFINFHWLHLHSTSPGHNWYTDSCYITENAQQDAA